MMLGSTAAYGQAAAPASGGSLTIYSGLLGDWVGQLEYRDFSSNERVALPTWLHVAPGADGKTVLFAYTYDDGPNKKVRELSTVVFDAATGTVSFTSDRDHSSDTFKAEGLEELAKAGGGKLVLTGKGLENGKPVDVRILMEIRRNLYTYRKETRLPGQDFVFRDGYTFTRKDTPQ